MEANNYVAQLNEYVQKSRSQLKYDDIGSDGPAHIKTFTQRVVLNGQPYPVGVGKSKKEARQNAAKHALEDLETDQIPSPDSGLSWSQSDKPVYLPNLTQPNYVCWLNEQSQRNRVSLHAEESTLMDQGRATPCCRFVLDGRTYPTACGRNKKDAKEEAAKLAYKEIVSDLPSKVSVKSAMSEEESTSNMAPTERDSTSSGGILFKDTSEPPKMSAKEEKLDVTKEEKLDVTKEEKLDVTKEEKLDVTKEEKLNVKPKIKLAARFPNAPKEHSKEDEMPNLKIQNPPTENTSQDVTTKSRFLDDFDEFELLGKGAHGQVYKARLKLVSQYYAVKIVRHKPKALREAKALAALDHRNVVRYFSVWSEQSRYNSSQWSTDWSGSYLYIQMELCEKKNLKVWIDERNVRCPDPARREDSRVIMWKIMCGVEYIHGQNLIHRDLKPLNIMFALSGEVKIGDFGLVTEDIDDAAGERTRNTGTRSFMAPEQRSTNVYDRKVDIFALGLVYFMMLWPMLTGHEKEETWDKVRLQTFPPDFEEKCPQEKDIIDSMLQESPGDRPHAKDVKDKLGGSDVLQQSQASSEE